MRDLPSRYFSLYLSISLSLHLFSFAAPLAFAQTQPATRPTTTATATAPGENLRHEAENKQKLSEVLEREARGEEDEAKKRLADVRERMEIAKRKNADTSSLEDDREYWQRKLEYEQRRLKQAELQREAGIQKQEIAQLVEKIRGARTAAEELREKRDKMDKSERQKQAEEFRKLAQQAVERAVPLEQQGDIRWQRAAKEGWMDVVRSANNLQDALRNEVETKYNTFHFSRMKRQLDAERQQIDSLMNTNDVIAFALMRRAALERRLAEIYRECAEILVPTVESFWERHRKVIKSIQIVAVTIALSYAVRAVIWMIQLQASRIGTRVAPKQFSIKRVQTLLSFAGSIFKLFLWVFAIVMVLNEFGIDPARSTGAIGLIGLILAGMFQQLVIDFVKGLDIVTGRHYNVGDFVELDGKTGHVIDFSVKHTRIRTASGQEYNLPNSKCIPSRRFPEGYVDNYVDVVLKEDVDLARAKRAIAPVCRYLGRRIEQVKDEPVFVDRLPGTKPHTIVLRYRVRVLPSCDWIVTSQFIPDVKASLAEEGIELAEEPTFFFINRIQTFRQLFSRKLSEEEILREADDQPATPPERPSQVAEIVAGRADKI